MTTDDILHACSAAWRVSVPQLLGRRKQTQVASARIAAAWFMRVRLSMERDQIAALFGKSPAWASWAFWSTEDRGETDRTFARLCQEANASLEAKGRAA